MSGSSGDANGAGRANSASLGDHEGGSSGDVVESPIISHSLDNNCVATSEPNTHAPQHAAYVNTHIQNMRPCPIYSPALATDIPPLCDGVDEHSHSTYQLNHLDLHDHLDPSDYLVQWDHVWPLPGVTFVAYLNTNSHLISTADNSTGTSTSSWYVGCRHSTLWPIFHR
jgi:hypothetical protein